MAAKEKRLPRAGTKAAKLLALCQRKGRATMAQMLKATGWKACLGTAKQVAVAAGKTFEIVRASGKANLWVAR
jgi:hypothetical protein